jgi:hypothetical protein
MIINCLNLSVFKHSFFTIVTTKSRFLITTEGNECLGETVGIYENSSCLDFTNESISNTHIVAEDNSSKSIFSVVSSLNNFIEGLPRFKDN